MPFTVLATLMTASILLSGEHGIDRTEKTVENFFTALQDMYADVL